MKVSPRGPAQIIILNLWNHGRPYFIFGTDTTDGYATLLLGSPSIFLPKAMALGQEIRAVMGHPADFEPSVRAAVETMLYTELRKTVTDAARRKRRVERSQAVERALFRWTDARRTWWCPFRDVIKAGRVRRKGPDNEAWILRMHLSVCLYVHVLMCMCGVCVVYVRSCV